MGCLYAFMPLLCCSYAAFMPFICIKNSCFFHKNLSKLTPIFAMSTSDKRPLTCCNNPYRESEK